ncbi:MAG: DUF2752 domain-containing protein, partial [Flavobacteriales bacterium]|nr:DUF2752 domain-containing protein [Flavobacteriales bacterium]
KYINFLYLSGLIALPIVLVLLPASFFDTGQSLCLSQLILHQECPGCGITRAVQHCIHFDFEIAWNYNKLVFLVLPVLIYIWTTQLVTTYKKIKKL